MDFAVLYGLVGVGCALTAGLRGGLTVRWLEVVLLVPFWPLLGPFTLGTGRRGVAPGGSIRTSGPDEAIPTEAFRDPDEARSLSEGLALTRERLRAIEGLLARPDFSESAALQRHRELLERGEERAAAAAQARAEHIARLARLRDRWARELGAVDELLTQLRVQSEMLRVVGDGSGDASRIADELLDRVAGFDAVLEDETLHET